MKEKIAIAVAEIPKTAILAFLLNYSELFVNEPSLILECLLLIIEFYKPSN